MQTETMDRTKCSEMYVEFAEQRTTTDDQVAVVATEAKMTGQFLHTMMSSMVFSFSRRASLAGSFIA
jgi:hypothetical protein